MNKQKMGNQELTLKQKQDITDIFNCIFDKPLNKSYYTIKNDIILYGIEFSNIKEEIKLKMGIFYKQLFCYLCNFIHPETDRIRFNKWKRTNLYKVKNRQL